MNQVHAVVVMKICEGAGRDMEGEWEGHGQGTSQMLTYDDISMKSI